MAMKAGRKNLQRATKEQDVTLQDGESIVQVVSLRGSNLVEVTDGRGQNSLALFPAKFQKTMWIKRGNFIIVDDSAKEKALESGSKVACIVSRVLQYDQVRVLQKSPQWPEAFRSPMTDELNKNPQAHTSMADELNKNPQAHTSMADELNKNPQVHTSMADELNKNPQVHTSMADELSKNPQAHTSEPEEEEENNSESSEDDDGLPPLEANTNRIRPYELYGNDESDSESDTDS